MSILNDVLRDLAAPNISNKGALEDRALLVSIPLVQKKYATWQLSLLIFILVFFFVSIAKSYFSIKKNAPARELAAIDAGLQYAQQSPATPETSVESPLSSEERKPEAVIVDTDKNIQPEVAENIALAKKAVAAHVLTYPREISAYEYYQKALKIDPKNSEAQQGLDDLAKLFLIYANTQQQLGDLAQSKNYEQRAVFVSPDFVKNHRSEFLVDQKRAELQATNQSQENSPTVATVSQMPIETRETIKPFVVSEARVAAPVTIKLSDKQTADHAQEFINSGRLREAKNLLKQFIQMDTHPELSGVLLADIYIQENAIADAKELATSAFFSETARAKIQAQIFSLQGDNDEAIALLEKFQSLAEPNEAYRSLLANLYHKTARYSQSVLAYQRLVNSFGDKPAYWLGIALAFDGLSQPHSALQAYQRLQAMSPLQPAVKNYTDTRIAALRGQ